MKDVFDLDNTNPRPFEQPFLVIEFKNVDRWMIDVNGEIDKYLHRHTEIIETLKSLSEDERIRRGLPEIFVISGECSDWTSQATPLLVGMLSRLAEEGLKVRRVYDYKGSTGPSHALINGAIFRRMRAEDIEVLKKAPLNSCDDDVAQYIPRILES